MTSYTIQMASKISGVGVHTIRAWEKRYKALVPNRDSSGHRTYTKTDIEKLMLLSELCLLGYTISKVAKIEIPDLKILLKDLGKTEESIDSPEFNLIKEKPTVDASASINILLFALRTYKLDVINQELSKIKTLISARDLALNIIRPMFLVLKELVLNGSFVASQEETVLKLLCFHSGHALYRQNERRDRHGINVLVVGLDGNTNDLELVIVGLLCNHYGFNYSFMGPSISHEALSDSIDFLSVNLLILSAQNSNSSQTFVEKTLAKVSSNVEIVFNGKLDINQDKIGIKRFKKFINLEDFDDYLSKKL